MPLGILNSDALVTVPKEKEILKFNLRLDTLNSNLPPIKYII